MSASPKECPIHPSLADDPTAEESIERFVISLAERIDALQDAESRGELRRLAVQTRALVIDAEDRGFDVLARGAEMLVARCREKNGEGARKQLVELTAIAHRIRLGHSGAM
jgi:hypothetical protein